MKESEAKKSKSLKENQSNFCASINFKIPSNKNRNFIEKSKTTTSNYPLITRTFQWYSFKKNLNCLRMNMKIQQWANKNDNKNGKTKKYWTVIIKKTNKDTLRKINICFKTQVGKHTHMNFPKSK